MKIWFWLFLLLAPLWVGCAPGYHETRPAYQEEPAQPKFYTNPETPEDKTQRIWRESIGG